MPSHPDRVRRNYPAPERPPEPQRPPQPKPDKPRDDDRPPREYTRGDRRTRKAG